MDNKWGLDLSYEHRAACPRCRSRSRDSAGNNLMIYGGDRGAFCWAADCGFTIPSAEHRANMGWDADEKEQEFEEVSTREPITEEENERVKSYTGTDAKGWRGIRKDTNAFFGVRYSYDEETGDPDCMYVPTTLNGKLVGYRRRIFPKDFSSPIGQVGKEVDMIGQFRFTNSKHTCIIVGGETKLLLTYQMMKDDLRARGKEDYEPPAVVCSTLGEGGAYKQAQAQYAFFDQFQKIVICMDADDAGREAAQKLAKVLPKGRVFIMNMRYKDADIYVEKGKENEFIRDFWNAKQYSPAGIVSATDIYGEIIERAKVKKLPFPPMLKKLNKALAGGINYGYIVNLLAGSGAGKSSFVNQCTAYWMQELGLKVGVVSLEAEAAEYGENLLSYAMGRKIALIEDMEERLNFVSSPEAEKAARSVFMDKDGKALLYLLDDRGDYSKLQEKIEEMIVACDVRVIVIDVISDVFAGMPIDQVDLWMAWEKKLVKEHNCIILNVAHTKKPSGGEKAASQGRALTEESLIGSGTQYRSAGINLSLQRDKTAEDPEVRNTTMVHLLKSRATGVTGPVGELWYDIHSHTLWDKEEYQQVHPREF